MANAFIGRRDTVYLLVGGVLILVLAILVVRPLALGDGVPVFHQDWQWPVDRVQCAGLSRFGTQPWNSAAAGSAQAYPEPWWPYAVQGGLCSALGPHMSVIAALGALVLLAGVLAALLSWRIFRNPYATGTTIALYIGSPVFLNKLQAGHVLFLASYALLPAIAYMALFGRGRWSWIVAGTLIGLGSAQQQFFFFDVLVYVVLAFGISAISSAANIALTILTAVVFTASEWIIALHFGGGSSLSTLATLPHYEAAQSAYPLDAVRAIGYIGGYDKKLLSDVLPFLWFTPVCALIGLVLHPTRALAYKIAFFGLVGFVFVSGTYGPGAPLWAYAFNHVAATTIFRELYNGAALLAFSSAILAGSAVMAFWKYARPLAFLATFAAIILGIAICARCALGLPLYTIDKGTRSSLEQIASAPGDFRFIAVPSIYPLTVPDIKSNGLSPLTLPLGSHESANSVGASFPSTYIGRITEETPPAGEIANSIALGAVVRIPGATPDFRRSLEPALRNLGDLRTPITKVRTVLFAPRAQRLRVTSIASRPGTLATLGASPSVIDSERGGTELDLVRLQTNVDPRLSWVRTAFWPALSQWVYAESPGVFTFTPKRQLHTPPAHIIAGAAYAPPRAYGCTEIRALNHHYALFACGRDPWFSGKPPIAISSAVTGASPIAVSALSGKPGNVRVIRSRQWDISADIDATRGSALVLAESFDPHWTVDFPGARHIRVDGFANGWLLDRDVHGTVHVRYTPATAFFFALYASYTLLILSLLLTAFGLCNFGSVQETANVFLD